MVVLAIVGGLVLLLLIIVIAIYNGLIVARQRVRESYSGVDTELQRRHDLIPNLVNTVKGYTQHERGLLEEITKLREQAEQLRPGDVTGEQVRVESQLSAALGQLRVRMEAYPELKASSNFQSLQAELANTEDRVQGALRFYNGNVRELNVKCESFPSNIVAGMFGFAKAEYFEIKNPEARESPKVQF
ncbi:MAG TPA: LemA family protein [Phycisphaerales bacterium]|nr:LemA family protein [Phycisphaerales bacterium]